ncbi:hypothetical protein MC885_003639 [Smutsia gigantea]|nr:hypothetical protein MC885_003639 [Smutsia gigantea]
MRASPQATSEPRTVWLQDGIFVTAVTLVPGEGTGSEPGPRQFLNTATSWGSGLADSATPAPLTSWINTSAGLHFTKTANPRGTALAEGSDIRLPEALKSIRQTLKAHQLPQRSIIDPSQKAGDRSNGRGRRQAEVLVTLAIQVDYWGCCPGACPPCLPIAHNPTSQPMKTRGSVNKVI